MSGLQQTNREQEQRGGSAADEAAPAGWLPSFGTLCSIGLAGSGLAWVGPYYFIEC